MVGQGQGAGRAISQTIATTVGVSYFITFKLAGNPDSLSMTWRESGQPVARRSTVR